MKKHDSVIIPNEFRDELNSVCKKLKLSQEKIKNLSGISQGTISNCFQGKPIIKANITRILNVIIEFTKEKNQDKTITAEQANKYLAIIEKINHSINLLIPKNYRAKPGGAMPIQAINKVNRKKPLWEMINALESYLFTMVIYGLPFSGKSSFLLELIEEARKKFFEVVFLDCNLILEKDPQKQFDEFITSFGQTMAYTLNLSKLRLTEPEYITLDLISCLSLRNRLSNNSPCLVIIDHADVLCNETIGKLERILGAFHNQRGSTATSFVVCGDLAKNFAGYAHPRVKIGWFDINEVGQFVRLYPEFSDSDMDLISSRIFSEFFGQPFLTHLVLDEFAPLDATGLENILDKACNFEGKFLDFAEIYQEITNRPEIKAAVKYLYLKKGKKQPSSKSLNYLRSINLLDQEGQPLPSKFFKKLAETI